MAHCHGQSLVFALSDLDIPALSAQLDAVEISRLDVPVTITAVTDLSPSVPSTGTATTSAVTGTLTFARDGDMITVSLPSSTFTNTTAGPPTGPILVTYTPTPALTAAQWAIYAPVTDVWRNTPYETAVNTPPSPTPATVHVNATNGVVTVWFSGATTNGNQAWLPNTVTGNQVAVYNRKI